MKKINPFRPGSPIVPGMVVGRINEIERIENSLFQTKADRSSHFMITGERGIGKTSLLAAFCARARTHGAAVVQLDCRAVEPTADEFLHALGVAAGRDVATAEEAAERLGRSATAWLSPSIRTRPSV